MYRILLFSYKTINNRYAPVQLKALLMENNELTTHVHDLRNSSDLAVTRAKTKYGDKLFQKTIPIMLNCTVRSTLKLPFLVFKKDVLLNLDFYLKKAINVNNNFLLSISLYKFFHCKKKREKRINS